MGKKGFGQQTSRCKLNLGSSVSFLGPSHLASLQILYTCWLRVDVLIFSYFFHTILRCSCRIHWIPGMKKGRAAKQCKMRRTGPGHEVGSRFRSGAPKHEAPKPALFYGGQHQFFYSFLTWTTKRSQIENVWTWCTTKPDLLTSWVLHGRGKIWPQPPPKWMGLLWFTTVAKLWISGSWISTHPPLATWSDFFWPRETRKKQPEIEILRIPE